MLFFDGGSPTTRGSLLPRYFYFIAEVRSPENSSRVCTEDRIKADVLEIVLFIVQELCESRGGRPGLSVLTSLLVSAWT